MERENEEKADMGILELWVGSNNGVQEGHVDKGRGTLCTACGHATE
jgi:hypothetical protein